MVNATNTPGGIEAARRHPLRWLVWLIGIAVLIGGIWLAVTLIWPTITFRYRLTVDVETPRGIKNGSSVIEVIVEHHIEFLPEVADVTTRVNGEAVFVDLGDGKNLVVTLTDRGTRRNAQEPRALDAGELPRQVLGIRMRPPSATREDIARALREPPTAIQLEPLPTVVTFRNLADPLSVEEVDPSDFAASLGVGYTIRGATIQATHDELTGEIVDRLTWLADLERRSLTLGGKKYSSGDSVRDLYSLAFSCKGFSP